MVANRTDTRFRFEMAREAPRARWTVLWSGHVDANGMLALCDALEAAVAECDGFDLLLDVRAVTGHDAEAHVVARRWSVGAIAQRIRSVALVLDSALMIALSPAASLCPPGRIEVFGTLRAATTWLDGSPVAGSGEFARVGLPPPVTRRAHGEE